MNISNIKPYSKAIVKLLKGIVEYNDPVWNDILIYQSDIQNYLSVIGLNLKKDEGFAFVKQAVLDDEKTLNLVTRRQLGFEVSVILIILRQMLEDFEMNPTDSQADEKYVTPSQIKDEVELFLPSRFNQIKFKQDLDNYISKVIDLGFLVASKQTLDALNDFKNKLNDYDTTDESI